MPSILIELGLKTGQKVAAKIGTKIVTAIGAAVASNVIIAKKRDKDVPISEEDEEYDIIVKKRASRDGLISGVCSVVGVAAFTLASVGIDNSN